MQLNIVRHVISRKPVAEPNMIRDTEPMSGWRSGMVRKMQVSVTCTNTVRCTRRKTAFDVAVPWLVAGIAKERDGVQAKCIRQESVRVTDAVAANFWQCSFWKVDRKWKD